MIKSRSPRYKITLYLLVVILLGYRMHWSWPAISIFAGSVFIVFLLGRLILACAKPAKTYFILKPYLVNLFEIVVLYTFLLFSVLQFQMIGFWWMLLLFGGYMWGKTLLQQLVFKKGCTVIKKKYRAEPEVFDRAVFENHRHQQFSGQIFIVKQTLVLFAKRKILTEIDLNSAEPRLLRHKFLSMPKGFYCPHHDIAVFLDLPRFWVQTINTKSQETWIA